MAEIFSPIIGYGRANATTTTGIVAADAVVLPLTSATGYSVGLPVFCSESDDDELTYCGTVASVNALNVTITVPLPLAKASGAKVWQPSAYCLFSHNFASPYRRELDTGVETTVSIGGQVTQTQVAEPVEVINWRYNQMLRADFASFRTFIESNRSYGTDSYSAAWYDFQENEQKVAEVRLDLRSVDYDASQYGFSRNQLRHYIINLDTWVES